MRALTPELVQGLCDSGPTDPIRFYRRPLVGRLFRERINRGLGLLSDRRYRRGLEIGYGAGAVQLALQDGVAELHGLDLDADAVVVRRLLGAHGVCPHLMRGSAYELPYRGGCFDLVVCFSVFEHLAEYRRALDEVARVLEPGGHFLLGMPSVNRSMSAAFRAIGFAGIDDHHVTTPRMVSDGFELAGLRVVRARHLDLPLPRPAGLRLYHNWLLTAC